VPDRSNFYISDRVSQRLLWCCAPVDTGLRQKAYRFVPNNPHVSAVISHMANEKQVREDLRVARAHGQFSLTSGPSVVRLSERTFSRYQLRPT